MLILSLWGWVWLIVVSFRETTTQGVLCLLVPCYQLYYYLTRWEDTRGSFCLHYSPLIGWAAIAVLTPFMLQGTKFDEALAENPQDAAQQAPNFNNARPVRGATFATGPVWPDARSGGFPWRTNTATRRESLTWSTEYPSRNDRRSTAAACRSLWRSRSLDHRVGDSPELRAREGSDRPRCVRRD
jgi:hypothetical protein